MRNVFPIYLALGPLSLPYTLRKNKEIKSSYIPGLVFLWPMAVTLSYTDMLKDMIPKRDFTDSLD